MFIFEISKLKIKMFWHFKYKYIQDLWLPHQPSVMTKRVAIYIYACKFEKETRIEEVKNDEENEC